MSDHHHPEFFGNTSVCGSTMQNQATSPNLSATAEEDLLGETDEPPDDGNRPLPLLQSSKLAESCQHFGKTRPPGNCRKHSLLTQALHSSEDDSHDDNHDAHPLWPATDSARGRGSTSITSSAELTSDGGITSSGTRGSTPSPPLPPTNFQTIVPLFDKPNLDGTGEMRHGDNGNAIQAPPVTAKSDEPAVEAGLGRKRCIKFACGKDPKVNAGSSTVPEPVTAEAPKRGCTLRFACPYKAPNDQLGVRKPESGPRAPSPAVRKPVPSPKASRRSSYSELRNGSPRSVRRASNAARQRKYSDNSDLGRNTATRFHEFASSEEEIDDWVQESTCHRSRLTVDDTLSVENGLRKLSEEVDEEALEDEDEDGDEDGLDETTEDDNCVGNDEEDENGESEDRQVNHALKDNYGDVSDEGFQTDDEEGFAGSDDESDAGSDYEWWTPGRSTAATSADQLDHIRPSRRRRISDSSIGSYGSPRANSNGKGHEGSTVEKKTEALAIRPGTPELPDSTDFVCGTLDEDRPLEDAYLSNLEWRKRAKHVMTPQDIDPTFPKSDPEMDEEDEVDEDDPTAEESDQHLLMHGHLDPHDDNEPRGRRAVAPKKKSPLHSPKRIRSPPPPLKRTAVHRSPPPRRLFGQSPKRLRSPPPLHRLKSPPTRRMFLENLPGTRAVDANHDEPAVRPPLVHTRSLPRTPSLFRTMPPFHSNQVSDEEKGPVEIHRRGAIDIVKGLEKKRQHRKEKLYEKYCRKAGKTKERRPQPGKGAERMRELGLELAACKGKCPRMVPNYQAHIISY